MKSVFIIPVAFFLAACGAPTPAPTPVSTATSTPTATATAVPTASVTPTPFTPAEYMEVYKYLDKSFALETGEANAEGVREIMTTNQLGEKVTVATVDANGNVEIGDVLKYKLTMDEKDKSCMMPLDKVENGLLPGVIARLWDSGVIDRKVTEGKIVKVGDYNYVWDNESHQYFAEHPDEIPNQLVGMCYAVDEGGREYPVRVYKWVSGGVIRYLTMLYRSTGTDQSTVPDEAAFFPAAPYTGPQVKYDDGIVNPLVATARSEQYRKAITEWRESGIIPALAEEVLWVGTTYSG